MPMKENTPIIVGFVADLMFTSKIQSVADGTGFEMVWMETAVSVGDIDPDAPPERPGEMLHGRGGQLFQKITDWQPVLLLFDLTNHAIPWQQWIPALKSSPATRRIPIMAFGPHEDVAVMQEAKRVGADQVLARSRFFSDMPKLFTTHARIPDYDALTETCAQPLPDLAREGIELYNQRQFYKCHDSLEEAWMADQSAGRDLYRGILQTGIALYQVERGNYRGAVKMLLRVRQWLDPLPDVCRQVDVAGLRQNIQQIHEAVLALGEGNLGDFDWEIVQKIQLRDDF